MLALDEMLKGFKCLRIHPIIHLLYTHPYLLRALYQCTSHLSRMTYSPPLTRLRSCGSVPGKSYSATTTSSSSSSSSSSPSSLSSSSAAGGTGGGGRRCRVRNRRRKSGGFNCGWYVNHKSVSVCVCVVTLSFLGSSPGIGGKGFLETRKEEQKRWTKQNAHRCCELWSLTCL